MQAFPQEKTAQRLGVERFQGVGLERVKGI